MKVEILKKKDIDKYINFIKEVFEYEPIKESIEQMIKKDKVLAIIKDDKVAASLVLEEKHEYIKNLKYYYISYFGTLKEYRRMGYGSKLFEKVDELVKENDIKYLELTSGNQRRAAHYFYKSKEFKLKDTTVFVKLY